MNAHTQVAVTRPSLDLVAGMAQGYGMEAAAFEKTIVATCFPSEKDRPSVAEFCGFLLVAKQYGLNPLTREIFGFRAKSGAIVPVVSVDGWVNLINSHPAMNGVEFDDRAEGGEVEAITCRIWRKDREKPIVVTEYMAECKRGSDTPWGRWPRRMLRHKALIQCARYAFGFAGIHDPDEAERMGADTSALREIPPEPPTPSDPAPAGGEPAASEPAKGSAEPEVAAGTAHDKDGVVWEEEGERAATANDVPEPPTPGATVDTTEDADGTPAFLKRTAKASEPAKVEPKAEAPKVEPKPEPKPAAKATPKAEPKAEPEAFDVAQWLKDLEGACGGCETLDELIAVQNKIQIPARRHVTTKTDWEKGKAIVLAASGRILGDSSDEP